jgi:hypothetical protein
VIGWRRGYGYRFDTLSLIDDIFFISHTHLSQKWKTATQLHICKVSFDLQKWPELLKSFSCNMPGEIWIQEQAGESLSSSSLVDFVFLQKFPSQPHPPSPPPRLSIQIQINTGHRKPRLLYDRTSTKPPSTSRRSRNDHGLRYRI